MEPQRRKSVANKKKERKEECYDMRTKPRRGENPERSEVKRHRGCPASRLGTIRSLNQCPDTAAKTRIMAVSVVHRKDTKDGDADEAARLG